MATTIFLIRPETFSGGFENQYSLVFDGVDEYVDLGSCPSALLSATNFTVSTWIKNSNVDCAPISFFENSTTCPIRIFVNSASNRLQVGIRNGANSLGYVNSFGTSASWRHITAVYDGTATGNANRLKVYVNGSLQTLTFVNTIPASTVSSIGVSADTYIARSVSTYLNGYIDETAIFDYSLDSTQVSSIYNSGTPTDLDNTSGVTAPVHWWRMGDGDTSPTITDVGTTGGIDGTMTNMEAGDIQTDVP